MTVRELTITGYAVLVLVAGTLLVAGRTGRIARLGEVVDMVVAGRVGRVLVVLAWWWLGWHFLVRTA